MFSVNCAPGFLKATKNIEVLDFLQTFLYAYFQFIPNIKSQQIELIKHFELVCNLMKTIAGKDSVILSCV